MLKRSPKTMLCCIFVLVVTIIPLLAGCGDSDVNNNTAQFLRNDAVASLKGAYGEDFARITIIRGALNKYLINPDNSQLLGNAVGATEAAVFPEEYEFKRFSQLENISAEMRKDIISQPMLNITARNREVLNHIYRSVLKPAAAKAEGGNPLPEPEVHVLNQLVGHLDSLAQNYSVLADKDVDFQSSEAQQAFYGIQNALREMQKLQLAK